MLQLPFSYHSIFSISSENEFNDLACKTFRYQYKNNIVYKGFVDLIKTNVNKVEHYTQIPFLPVSFFKSHQIISGNATIETIFYSSGTTKTGSSKHHVADLEIYRQSMLQSFNYSYGKISDYSIFALLPSYSNNKNSSLLYMINQFIQQSGNVGGFYLDNTDDLLSDIEIAKKNKKVVLIGVAYALLDLADKYQPNLQDVIVIETGGMKGRRKELTKKELHGVLKKSFNVNQIGSEYGMTELLSQAWSKKNGLFECPPWLKILTRDCTDPLQLITKKTGGINCIDLANIHSCSFIATQDLGKIQGNQFEVLGRFDNADLRGCNLLVDQD